jgi:F-type H+-transporting ATPase subunit delta
MTTISKRDLARALQPMLSSSKDQAKLAQAIAQYLTQNRRTKELDGIMRSLTSLREQEGVVETTVTSAFPLSSDLKRNIRTLITKERQAKDVIINEVVDTSVIGGLKIETGEHQLDVTIQTKLESLKRAIV